VKRCATAQRPAALRESQELCHGADAPNYLIYWKKTELALKVYFGGPFCRQLRWRALRHLHN
jgi:hypothetical protein